jgi:hypothetical protein
VAGRRGCSGCGYGSTAARDGHWDAYIKRGGKAGKVYAPRLVTQGLFGHSRNPLYVGNLLVLLGVFLVHNNSVVYHIGVPFFLFAYTSIVRYGGGIPPAAVRRRLR